MKSNLELNLALNAALRAGDAIMEIYRRDFEVEFKADESPLTEADKAAHQIIVDALEETGLPVLSEESRAVPYEERSNWTRYWLVDPLDGTKEFIKKNGEFTVNIALIENGRPILGVVYAPVLRTIYYGSQAEGMAHGAWKCTDCADKPVDEMFSSAVSLPITNNQSPITRGGAAIRVVASRSHCNEETKAFIQALEKEFGEVELVSSGSSLKLCLVAEGSADLYPRIAPTMEWDTAAAQAVVEAAGGRVVAYDTAVPAASYICGKLEVESKTSDITHPTSHLLHPTAALRYNKPDLLNPSFIVVGRC